MTVGTVSVGAAEGVDDPASRASVPSDSQPRNIILFVADGMGFAHLAAARSVMEGGRAWDRFPVTGWHHASAADHLLTDSAASATALSTGHQTTNGAIGVDAGGDSVPTLFEHAAEQGYRTGIVTDSYIWDATPASFVARAGDRGEADRILGQMVDSRLDLLVGELDDARRREFRPRFADGFEVVAEAPVAAIRETTEPLAVFRPDEAITDLDSEPDLAELTEAALARMARDDSRFVLLVESEEPDSASHAQDYDRMLRGMAAVEASLARILDFARQREDTLVIFTSDHETGGLSLHADGGESAFAGRWNTSGHTGEPVPVMASGPAQGRFSGVHTNQGIGRLLHQLLVQRGR
jgi:alkaline phosphatase